MKTIVIAFTLKGQDFEKIKKGLDKVKEMHGEQEVILLHGFMSRDALNEKKIPTTVIDELEKRFPKWVNFFEKVPLRQAMCDYAVQNLAEVYVVGEIVEGVLDEVILYRKNKLKIHHIPI